MGLKPQLNDINKIEGWLLEEKRNTGHSFHVNWDIIRNAFYNDRVLVFHQDNKVVGFTVFTENIIHVNIDIFVIHPEYTNKGIGCAFLNKISIEILERGFVALWLYCEPEKSERFWQKMGFIKSVDRGYSDHPLTYFKLLIPVRPYSDVPQKSNHKMELWDTEPFAAADVPPRWTWDLNSDQIVAPPILHPCNPNWNLRWTRNGKVLKENKIKRFQSTKNRIEFSPFLYIRQLGEN